MSDPVKSILRFLLFVGVQGLILSNLPPLHRTITPYLYFLFLIWLPFTHNKMAVLIWGFVLGFAVDLFTKTPGLHASAALWVAFFRGPLISLLVPKDTRDLKTGTPGVGSMGFSAYFIMVVILTIIHHSWVVLIEWMYFGNFWYYLQKVFMSTLISLLLILVTEMLFRSTRKRRIG